MILHACSNNPPAFLKRGLGGVKKTGRAKFFQLALIFFLPFSLTACWASEKVIHWQQEVKLQDGRMIMIDRLSKQIGPGFPEHVIIEKEQTLSFTNPETKEKIIWTIPAGLRPRMIDFDNKIPYIVFRAGSVADYNTWNCPNPPHIIFRYIGHKWQQINLDQLPARLIKPNTLDSAHADDQASADNLVTTAEMQSFLKRSQLDERRTISRKRIHPIAEGCYPDILIKQGRESEINVPYYNDAGVRVVPKNSSF